MQCPRCLLDNPSHAKFCLECGTPVRHRDGSNQPAQSYMELQRSLTEAHSQVSEALERQTATAEILRVISRSQTDVQPVFETIADNAVQLFRPWSTAVYRFDGEFVHVAATRGGLPGSDQYLREQGARRPTREFMAGRCLVDRSVVHISDFETDPSVPALAREIARQRGFRATLNVPMVRGEQPIGVISVSRAEAGAFSQQEIELLQTFADQAVIAIENVRLFKELEARNRDLSETLDRQTATADVLRIIAQSPTELQPVLDAIATSAVRLCAASDAVIERLEGDRFYNAAHAGAQMKGLVGLALPLTRRFPGGRAILDREPVILDDIHLVAEREYPDTLELLKLNTIHSVAEIPLLSEGKPLGSLAVLRAEVRPFSDAEVSLLKTFADQAVIAIENVRLFKELETRNRALTQAHAQVTEALEQQTATSEILRVISSAHTDAQLVFDTIVQRAVRLCNGTSAAVFRTDGRMVYEPANYGSSPEVLAATRARYPRPLDMETTPGIAILTRSVVHVPDIEDPSAIEFVRQSGRLLGCRSVITVPMLREGEAVGAIIVTRREPGLFSDAELKLLKTFADQAVIAIENVRLFRELQEKNLALTEAHARVSEALEQQTATAEILRVISRSQTDVQPVFDTIVRSAVTLCDGLFSVLYRFDGELLHHVAQHNFTPEALEEMHRVFPVRPTRALGAGRVILERAVVQIPDVAVDPEYQHPALVRTIGWRSSLFVPMLREGVPIGVIVVARAEPGSFANNEIELLKTFADQAVIAVENVRLFKELQARTQELTRSVGQLTALGEVGRAVSSTLDLETVLTTIVSRAVQLSGLDGGVVFEYDEAAEEFVQRAAAETGGALAEARRGVRYRKGEGALGRTAITLEPVQVPDITVRGAYDSRVRENLIESGIRAILAVPMVRDDR